MNHIGDTPPGCVTCYNQIRRYRRNLIVPVKTGFSKRRRDSILSPYDAVSLYFLNIYLRWRLILFDLFSEFLANPQAHMTWRRNSQSVCRSRCTRRKLNPSALSRFPRTSLNVSPNLTISTVTSNHSQWTKETSSTPQCHWRPLRSCGDIKQMASAMWELRNSCFPERRLAVGSDVSKQER